MFFGAILTSGFSAGWSIVKLILITVLVLVLAFLFYETDREISEQYMVSEE